MQVCANYRTEAVLSFPIDIRPLGKIAGHIGGSVLPAELEYYRAVMTRSKLALWLSVWIVNSSCNRSTKEPASLEAVHDATLRVKAQIAVGVTRADFPKPLYDLAYEIMRAESTMLDPREKQSLEQYKRALDVYKASMQIWQAHGELEACRIRYPLTGFKSCTVPNAPELAKAAEITVDRVAAADAVQLVWQVAEQKLAKAEEFRLRPQP